MEIINYSEGRIIYMFLHKLFHDKINKTTKKDICRNYKLLACKRKLQINDDNYVNLRKKSKTLERNGSKHYMSITKIKKKFDSDFIEYEIKEEINLYEIELHESIFSYLKENGFQKLTLLQKKVLSAIYSKQNIAIHSDKGTGKSLAYALAIVQQLITVIPTISREHGIQSLIVVPTKDDVFQMVEIFKGLLINFPHITIGIMYGKNIKKEKHMLKRGTSILISTSGQVIEHLINSKSLNINKLRSVVIDGVDTFIEMNEEDIIERIMNIIELVQTYREDYIPGPQPKIQTVFVSTALDVKVQEIRDKLMHEYKAVVFKKDQTLN